MIREAKQIDASAIALVHVRSWQSAYPGLVPQAKLDGLSVDRRANTWTEILTAASSRGQQIWVEERDVIVGFVCVGPSRDPDVDPESVGELQAIYLLPSVWSEGIGRELHDVGIGYLRARGHTEATLWVVEGNARAIAFYERQGWQPDGAAKHEVWDDTPMDEVRYRLTL